MKQKWIYSIKTMSVTFALASISSLSMAAIQGLHFHIRIGKLPVIIPGYTVLPDINPTQTWMASFGAIRACCGCEQ